jgi:flagellar hook assembly protein FlgD
VIEPTARRTLSGVLLRSAAAAVLALAALLPLGASLAPVAEAAAPNGPKVVIVAGPVGIHNRHYKADADALAKVARKYTRNVVLIKTPHATWPAVKAAAQGASIFVYLGHGNGWPSKYRDYLWPFTQNGLGLDPVSGADGSAHVYYGEAQVASEIRFAPNAVVLLFHLCYASGNTEPGLPTGTLVDKKARADNYGAGFFAAGARAVIADAYDANTPYMSRLFTSTSTLEKLFHAVPTYHGHDIAWDSFRSTGAKIIMDPTSIAKGPYYHSIVYDPGLTAKLVTRTAYRPTDQVPATIVIPGAATARAATDLFTDSGLGSPASTLAAGSRLRLLSEAPALADGSRVVEVRTLDGALAGYVRADALDPADSTPAQLYNYDPPGVLVGPNGDYVFDTFRVIVRASEPLDGTVTIKNDAGATVKTLTASDAWSVFDWDLQDAGGTLVPDGRYSWSYTGTEPWGNNAAPFTRSGAFVLDATDPTTAASTSGTLDPSGWYSTAATVKLTARDGLSGMRATYYTLDGGKKTRYAGPVAIAKSGDHELDYWSVDKAGNVERTRTLGVKVDVTAPLTKAQLSGPVGEPGFYRDDVTVGLAATDAQSGVASSEIGVDGAPLATYDGPIVVAAAGTHEVAFRSTDLTGRREKTRTVTFTIDRTAPTLGDPGTVVPSAGQFSPNGDGLADTVSVSHALTERGAIRLVVTPAAGGAALRTVTIPVAQAGPGSITWDGRDDDGAYVPDGDYALTLTPLDRARNAGPNQAATVAVFGAFVGLTPAPARFYPQDGDTLAAQTAATFRLNRGANVELKVLNAKGVVVRTIADTFPAGPVSMGWDGRTDGGAFAPQGLYRFVVRVTAGGRSETHATAVRAAAFELRPSDLHPRRGGKLKVTIVTAEPLKGTPKLTVRQPGLRVYAVRLTKVGPSTYRAIWTLKAGGRSGKLTLTVAGTDRLGGRNVTPLSLHIR